MSIRISKSAQSISHLVITVLTLVAIALSLTAQAHAGTETILYNFDINNGQYPYAGLISDAAGNLYGTTPNGGHGLGVVFKLSPASGGGWTETTLYAFAGPDGMTPYSALVMDAAGNLYGTTIGGGTYGHGVVFKLEPASGGWTRIIIHYFSGGNDGGQPYGNLIFDAAGNLYGTTYEGGSSGHGTVFTLKPASGGYWQESVLHNFSGGTDGSGPYAGLTFDAAGNLYGTTTAGGDAAACSSPAQVCGTVFKLSHGSGNAWKETVLHAFTNGIDGGAPFAGVVIDSAGNLYGTTTSGGNTSCKYDAYGCGTVFKLTPSSSGAWKLNVLHAFSGGGDGGYPYAALTLDSAGNLYGTTFNGGASGWGVVFKLAPGSGGGWLESVLHGFKAGDGIYPTASLIIDSSGNLYGTTSTGGANDAGTVFEVTP